MRCHVLTLPESLSTLGTPERFVPLVHCANVLFQILREKEATIAAARRASVWSLFLVHTGDVFLKVCITQKRAVAESTRDDFLPDVLGATVYLVQMVQQAKLLRETAATQRADMWP